MTDTILEVTGVIAMGVILAYMWSVGAKKASAERQAGTISSPVLALSFLGCCCTNAPKRAVHFG